MSFFHVRPVDIFRPVDINWSEAPNLRPFYLRPFYLRPFYLRPVLLTNVQATQQIEVQLRIHAFYVIQEAATSADHSQ